MTGSFEIDVQTTESALLTALKEMSEERIDPDRQYLTAYNGETWNDGFDLPFLRSACVRHQIDWPFPELAYVDVMTVIDRFNTGDATDLASVYDRLIGAEHCDPFTESESAIKAYETGNWQDLLLHNLADIQRTRELAILAEQYVPKSDFNMKNLAPPNK